MWWSSYATSVAVSVGALRRRVAGRVAFGCGASTGGFTQALLGGARRVLRPRGVPAERRQRHSASRCGLPLPGRCGAIGLYALHLDGTNRRSEMRIIPTAMHATTAAEGADWALIATAALDTLMAGPKRSRAAKAAG